MTTGCLWKGALLFAIQSAVIFFPFQNSCADEVKLDEIFHHIDHAPSWSGMKVESQGQQLVQAIEETKHLSTPELKAIITRLLSVNNKTAKFFGTWSKIYVLNRFFFKVPPSYQPNEEIKSFGAWWIAHSKGPLYPLVEKPNGEFVILEGYIGGYMGRLYEPLSEADYFNLKYGRRFPQ